MQHMADAGRGQTHAAVAAGARVFTEETVLEALYGGAVAVQQGGRSVHKHLELLVKVGLICFVGVRVFVRVCVV